MFKEEYKRAYDNIVPTGDRIQEIWERAEERKAKKWNRFMAVMRPIAVSVVTVCLFSVLVLPVAAKNIPAVYRVIERYAPTLTEYLLPEKIVSTKQGITMQVEAIDIVDNEAEVLISFSDAEGSDRDIIRGKVDMYDSYYLHNFGAQWFAGGASFLEYDEAEDKAYFKIQLSASKAYEKDRVTMGVGQLLTNFTEEERSIDISALLSNPKEKTVTLSGGSVDGKKFPSYPRTGSETDPRPECRVMDIIERNEDMAEELTITGVAYYDGVLKVQSCRGNFADADRHIDPYLKDARGNVRHYDESISWQEEINGERVLLEEHWFVISEEELQQYGLYAMFYITDGCVKGNWEVTFTLE